VRRTCVVVGHDDVTLAATFPLVVARRDLPRPRELVIGACTRAMDAILVRFGAAL
jgi:hypothetical protein